MYISKFVKFILIMKSTKWKGLEMRGWIGDLEYGVQIGHGAVQFLTIFSSTLCSAV